TQRGYRFLEKLSDIRPQDEIIVFSFREEPWEPPFLDDIQALAWSRGYRFVESKKVASHYLDEFWETEEIDLMLVVSWRYLLPADVYQLPRFGTFVFHDSLLPEYRGFAPTVWAIINGNNHTGVTLFEIAEEVDSGDIIDQQRVNINLDDTIAIIMEKVTQVYLEILEHNLDKLLAGDAPRTPQDHFLATYTCKRLPEDNQIDWNSSSESIYNLIRAVSQPYTGAYTYLLGKKIFIWSAKRMTNINYIGSIPGRVVKVLPDIGSVVLTGDGALLVTLVQRHGEEILCADKVLNSINQTLGYTGKTS
ncbi:MAG: methionyl-tRNA formyltransferase, partial [Anaerolineales bacterium]|nr:methionyl-tRNA formyltransferase [Anaerolineales bacterium]